MARIESGGAFHVFAAKYRKDLRPCLVLLTLGNESMFVTLKLYSVSFTWSRFTRGVGAFSWKQLFIVTRDHDLLIVIMMSWIRLPSSVLCKPPGVGGTPLFGLYGDVPLDRVWFFGLAAVNRVYNLTCLCPTQGQNLS